MELLAILVLFCVIQVNRAANYELNGTEEEYSRLPPLVWLDEYGSCLRRPGGRFCTAHASYVDGDPDLLTIIQKYSANTSTRFNHSRALFGCCVSHNCRSEEKTTSDPKHLLEGCLNRTVWDKYRLRVKLDDEVFCHEHGEKKPDIGTVDVIIAAILLGLVMCNIVGSLFDICCCRTTWKDGFVGQFLLFFSIPRNLKILTAPPDPKMECLRGIYGIRAIKVALMIVLHSLLPAAALPRNPKFIEDMYSQPAFYILLNGTVIMQTFLFVSAFLLVYRFQHHGIQPSWTTLPMWVLRRWLRLTPAYMLVLAVTATWLPRISSGPLWDSLVVAEAASCRAVWWQHLLYINNYFDGTLCMRPTWYLATDMQLYVLGLAVLACCRSLRARQLVLGGLFLLGLLLPALHTYLHDLDGILLISPSSSSSLFTSDATFNEVYKRAHTNLCSYVLGLGAGYLVYALQGNNFSAHTYKSLRPLYWVLAPGSILLIASCQAFYNTTTRVGLPYRLLSAALLKPAFGMLMAVVIVGMLFKIESVYRGVLSWRGWVPLGRVSYSAYLLHMAYVLPSVGALQYPVNITMLRLCEIVVLTVVTVNATACLFWLTVEAPLSHVVKSCFQTYTRQQGQNKPTEQVDKHTHSK